MAKGARTGIPVRAHLLQLLNVGRVIRMIRPLTTFLAVSLVGLVLAACGGGGGSEDAPTKAAFIKEADAICRRTDAKQLGALEKYAKGHNLYSLNKPQQAKLAVAVGVPAIRTEAKELGELAPPDGDEARIQAVVQGIEEAADEGEAHPTSMGTGPTNAFIDVNRLTKQYGFKDCADVS
jgi:hypothetical protein